MKLFFKIISLVTFFFTLIGCTDMLEKKETGILTGEIFYLQRIALPPEANLTVTLADVSKADASMEVISSRSYSTKDKPMPFTFELNYLMNVIKQNHTYNLSARITVNDEIIFISDTAHPVITDPNKTSDVKIKVVSINHD